MSKIVVFDFDKTLTYHDTLLGFFLLAGKKNISYPFKILIYVIVMFFVKFNLLSNIDLKRIGIFLFLKGINKIQLKSVAKEYISKIKFNNLFYEYDFKSKDKVYIVSASFSEYLKPIFPNNVNVIGSEICYEQDIVSGLKLNCYGLQKQKILKKQGVLFIDTLYTDSFNDFSIASLAKKIIIVSGDKKHECYSLKDFKSFFKKQ